MLFTKKTYIKNKQNQEEPIFTLLNPVTLIHKTPKH